MPATCSRHRGESARRLNPSLGKHRCQNFRSYVGKIEIKFLNLPLLMPVKRRFRVGTPTSRALP